jgi:hypothetical protein
VAASVTARLSQSAATASGALPSGVGDAQAFDAPDARAGVALLGAEPAVEAKKPLLDHAA